MKLYSVDSAAVLVEANVVRETPQFYFVDTSALSGWSKRIAKNEVNLTFGLYRARVYTTPLAAWEAFQHKQHAHQRALKDKLEYATQALQVAQRAVDALRVAR